MRIRRGTQLLSFLPIFLFCSGLSAPLRAQRADSLAEMVRDVSELSVEKPAPGLSNEQLTIRRRQDLGELFSTLPEKKSAEDVYFYEVQSPPGRVSESSWAWVVAVARFPQDVYKVYSFLGSTEPKASSQEFNRFTSQLALSISEERAIGLSRLFLESCVDGDAKETVLDDETELRLAVQNYYWAAYGDLGRALDAYSRWWQGFQVHAPDLAPTVTTDKNGRYHVVLNRLLTFAGRHPLVQQWELEISREGEIRVLAMQPLFPDQQSWLFYDLDSSPDFSSGAALWSYPE